MDKNDVTILRWFMAFLMVLVIGITGAIASYYWFQSVNVSNCVEAGGSWTDINPGYNTDMGCVNK